MGSRQTPTKTTSLGDKTILNTMQDELQQVLNVDPYTLIIFEC